MLEILTTLLYIFLFLICLSLLIIIHEFGHLTAAKAFKVYCLEFSCGMGPLLWKHKKKDGETQFSLRAIPFGGYVSMYGEGVELPEGVKVDDSRSLNGIKKWKQAIIIAAGVFMNAILALVIFFVNNVAFEQQSFEYMNKIDVTSGSICEKAGLKSEDILSFADKSVWSDDTTLMLRNPGTVTFTDDSNATTMIALEPVSSFKEPVYAFNFYGYDGSVVNTAISYKENIKNVSINFETKEGTADNPIYTDHMVTINFNDGAMEDCGLRIYVKHYRYSFGEAVKQTFDDFGYSATAIGGSLIEMFTGKVGVDQMSGIVGIGFEAKSILDDLGISKFIFLWGLISVNLAIVNLLPFPGLDGWQLLVIAIEGITRKKIPDKVKNIVSFIGLALLLLFMAAILLKDVWVYIFHGFVAGIML